MIATPRMKTDIRKDRYRMFSIVTIEHEGRTAVTTMQVDAQASDLQVENLKRQLACLPKIKAEA